MTSDQQAAFAPPAPKPEFSFAKLQQAITNLPTEATQADNGYRWEVCDPLTPIEMKVLTMVVHQYDPNALVFTSFDQHDKQRKTQTFIALTHVDGHMKDAPLKHLDEMRDILGIFAASPELLGATQMTTAGGKQMT